MRNTVCKYILPLFLLFLVACEVKIPDNIIQPDKLEVLLYDYHLAQAMGVDAGGDYKRKLYADYVFEKHGITKELFDSSMIWYSRNPKYLYDIYGSMHDRLAVEVDALSGEKNKILLSEHAYDMNAYTVNLWQGVRVALLSATPLKNRVAFSFQADSSYHRGDSVALSVDVLFISPKDKNIRQKAYAAVILEYADSTFATSGLAIADAGHYAIGLERNRENDIKNVRGYIYYTDNDSLAESRLLLGNISVMRIRASEEDLEFE